MKIKLNEVKGIVNDFISFNGLQFYTWDDMDVEFNTNVFDDNHGSISLSDKKHLHYFADYLMEEVINYYIGLECEEEDLHDNHINILRSYLIYILNNFPAYLYDKLSPKED